MIGLIKHARRPTKTVAVVVPMHNREELLPEEQISLRHLVHYLGKYDKYLVVPTGLEVNYPGFRIKRFSGKYFGSAKAYIRLQFQPSFYESFSEYKYILIYHLDALVFSDQLMEWCEADFDYVGAPWIKHPEAPYAGRNEFEGKVGNGGFLLVKIQSCLKVIYSPGYRIDPRIHWERHYKSRPAHIKLLQLPRNYLRYLKVFNNARWEMAQWQRSGDAFWANRAKHYYPEFKIPSVETALRFAFESLPRYCFDRTNHTLPFGCHAWTRYDREFWEPYLLK